MSKKLEFFFEIKEKILNFLLQIKIFNCIIRIQNLWMLEVQVFFYPFWSNVTPV